MKVKSRKPAVSLVNFKRKKPELSKKESQEIHFRNRFYERVGFEISKSSYDYLKSLVRAYGKFLYREETSDNSIYSICYNGFNIKVVYNAFTDSLITILPP